MHWEQAASEKVQRPHEIPSLLTTGAQLIGQGWGWGRLCAWGIAVRAMRYAAVGDMLM